MPKLGLGIYAESSETLSKGGRAEVKAGGAERLLGHSTWHKEPRGAGLGFQHVTLWKSSRTFRQEIVTPPYF